MDELNKENNGVDEYYEEEEISDEELIVSDDVERKIIWQPKDFTIRELQTMKLDGDLDLQPDYQRNFVIDKPKASRLIESILMDVPIPVIYLAEEKDGSFSVIDGQQRLASFIGFVEGIFPDDKKTDFKLTGLRILRELNKKKFSDLDKKLQNKIKTTTLHSILIKKESNDDIKFEIFERLNTGAIKLNEDEIRNSVYRGPYIELLDELAENSVFHSLVRKDNFKKRMIYRGMILRFLALSEKSYMNYKPSIKQFCNKELRDNRFLNKDKAGEYKKRFEHCIDLCRTVFGENSFRRFLPGNEDDFNGKWTTSRINMALYDIQMCGFAIYDKNQIVSHSDEIRDKLLQLMTNDEEFIRSIEIQTSDKEQVTKRFKIWFDTLDSIVTHKQQDRNFAYKIKEELFAKDKKCKLCNQNIMMIEDSEVDHIIPFSKGGKTEIKNAQITHRYCNRKKNNSV